MEIIKKKLSEIIPYVGNAKQHPQTQIDQIKASIIEFGFNDPLAIDENNVIIEGHGRYEALKQLGQEEIEVIVLGHMTKAQKKAYILAHNKLTMNTGFNEEMLKTELEQIKDLDFDLELTGFEDWELDGILNSDHDIDDLFEDEENVEKEPKRCPHCGEEL